jgi:hypothetical protein
MNEADVADWARALSKNERLILATYEGERCMLEAIERYWNPKALEKLIMHDIVRWTMNGYELSEEGWLLAKFIHDQEGGNQSNSKRSGSKKRSRRRMTFGGPCPECGAEVVRIKRETLNQMMEMFGASVRSVSTGQINGKRACIPICPQCDAYALGIEIDTGFPFTLKNGEACNIHRIADMLWQPEPFRSENLAKAQPDSADGGRAKVIPFPVYTVPFIDWEEIEQIRAERYPDLPAQILEVLEPLMASTPSDGTACDLEVEAFSDDPYPPQPIPMIPGKAGAMWLMDLLDRFGGQVTYGDLTCAVERQDPKFPVFQVGPLSRGQFAGIDDCLQAYDFMIEDSRWRIFAKYLSDVGLVVLFAKDLTDADRIFQGMFDRNTFEIVKERLCEGKQSWTEILLLDD